MSGKKGKKTVVLGVLGVDAHVVGNKIMAYALEAEGFKVVNIGTFSSRKISSRQRSRRLPTPFWWVRSAATGSWNAAGFAKIVSKPGSSISIWSLEETWWWENRNGKKWKDASSRWASTVPIRLESPPKK